MIWNGDFVESGIVTYSVNGVAVTKSVVRQSLVYDNYNGTYAGAIHSNTIGCSIPSNDGTVEQFATFSVTPNGQSVTVTYANEQGNGCTFSGTLTQGGHFGKILGS